MRKLLSQPREKVIAVVGVGEKQYVNLAGTDKIADKLRVVCGIKKARQIKDIRNAVFEPLPPALLARNGRQDADLKPAFVDIPADVQIKEICAAHLHPREKHHNVYLVMAGKCLPIKGGGSRSGKAIGRASAGKLDGFGGGNDRFGGVCNHLLRTQSGVGIFAHNG